MFLSGFDTLITLIQCRRKTIIGRQCTTIDDSRVVIHCQLIIESRTSMCKYFSNWRQMMTTRLPECEHGSVDIFKKKSKLFFFFNQIANFCFQKREHFHYWLPEHHSVIGYVERANEMSSFSFFRLHSTCSLFLESGAYKDFPRISLPFSSIF